MLLRDKLEYLLDEIVGPGVDLIKLFGHKFTYSFCKLDLFIPMQQIFLMFKNGLAYKKV